MTGATVTAVRRQRLRAVAIISGAATFGVVLAGCGGGSTPSRSVRAGGADPGAAPALFETVSGKVIAASATSATVQAASGPSTVAFTTSTRFTKSSPTQRSSLAKGDCVTVASTDATVPTARSTSGATSNGILRPPRKVTARSVTVTSTSGCRQTGQFRDGFTGTPPPDGPRFGNGEVPRPFATGTPPSGAGSNAQRPGIVRNRLGVGVLGTITSISGTTFTVASTFAESAKTTVTTTADTTYDAIATVTAADIDKGACLSAVGSTDVSGVLDARSVAISQPDNGTCRSAGPPFGGGRFFTSGGPGGVSEGGSGA